MRLITAKTLHLNVVDTIIEGPTMTFDLQVARSTECWAAMRRGDRGGNAHVEQSHLHHQRDCDDQGALRGPPHSLVSWIQSLPFRQESQWARRVSNLRPLACEAGVARLSYRDKNSQFAGILRA